MPAKRKEPAVRNILIALPEDLHHKVKLKATEQRLTLKAYVIETLRRSIEKGGETGKK